MKLVLSLIASSLLPTLAETNNRAVEVKLAGNIDAGLKKMQASGIGKVPSYTTIQPIGTSASPTRRKIQVNYRCPAVKEVSLAVRAWKIAGVSAITLLAGTLLVNLLR